MDRRRRFARARLAGARLGGRIVGWPLNTLRADGGRRAERVPFIGDAAGFVDPIKGEGMQTPGQRRIAAQVANEALWAGTFSAEFLSAYERRWRAAFDLDRRTAELIVSTVSSRRSLMATGPGLSTESQTRVLEPAGTRQSSPGPSVVRSAAAGP